MPEYVLDTSGSVAEPVWQTPPMLTVGRPLTWRDLDAFTQGYIEAMFFTENAPGVTTEEWQATEDHDEGSIPGDVGFADLAPETLAQIIEDCRRFQAGGGEALRLESVRVYDPEGPTPNYDKWCYTQEDDAGRDFWYTRNGHGCGFWDGDWPEPYATTLTEAARAFGSVDAYLGDDGKVYLS